MKTILILPLFVLLLAACGTSAPIEAVSTPGAPTATTIPSEIPSIAPTATDLPPATPSPTPTDSAALRSPTTLPTEDCINKAAFSDDVTIPDGTLVKMGESFNKVWRVRNEGTCTWTGYELVYAGGEAMNGTLSNPVPVFKPNEYGDVSVDLQAPQRGGGYTGYWLFKNTAGQTFGVGSEGDGMLWVQINVEFPLPSGPTPVAAAGATPVSSGTTPVTATSPVSNQSGCIYTQNSTYESQILGLINNVRAQNGLGALALDSQLSAAALEHSLDMACNDNISHTGTDGSTWYDRARKQGFANYNSARENIYVGNPAFGGDANGAFTWWMNSEIHRKTLMNADAKLIGISYIYSDASTYGGNYTTVFAR